MLHQIMDFTRIHAMPDSPLGLVTTHPECFFFTFNGIHFKHSTNNSDKFSTFFPQFIKLFSLKTNSRRIFRSLNINLRTLFPQKAMP